MLKSEPSLEIYCKSEDLMTGIAENLERTVTIGDSIDDGEFSFVKQHIDDILSIKEEEEKLGFGDDEIERSPSPPMHLAAGLGITDKFHLYGNEIKFDLLSFDDENCDDCYQKLLDEYPLHPLLLKNYAKFLEYKGDVNGAEEYYHKCTVVEPSDGLALANYGRLVMKLHGDEAKALSYFERAVKASPKDSDVLAAYASFLWEINADDDDDDDDDDEDNEGDDESFGDRTGKGKSKAEENRSSSLSETEDGETLCRYAKAFWSINGDQEKALYYFEKAVEASPNDSIILGEYARFLWEIDE